MTELVKVELTKRELNHIPVNPEMRGNAGARTHKEKPCS